MHCRKCPRSAVIKMPRHNTALCKDCFTEFVRTQVRRAIASHRMFTADDRILVAVSGGKDSLALWSILLQLGYRADALYVNLGIGDYSVQSRQKVQRFTDTVAAPYRVTLHIHTIEQEQGAGIRELATLVRRPTCAACGTMKRYQFNRVAVERDYDVMATGHNLDDEAARLLGNVLHWQTDYLDKQAPVLPASLDGFAKKVKPLHRLTEREIAAYALLHRIDYIVDECPMAKGSKLLAYKHALNQLEMESPGTKQNFYLQFLERRAASPDAHHTMAEQDRQHLHPCTACGQPTSAEVCSYCRMMARARAEAGAPAH